jgi:hypothetical protein
MRRATYVIVTAALVAVPASLEAQTPRRQAPIEIRGQVPTPQVVTVRPREVPAYSRQVLVPNFYDHDFWPSILPGYQIVQPRTVTGRMPGDTATATGTVPGTPPAVQGDTTRTVPPASPAATPPAGGTGTTPADTTRPPGTASALPRR